MSMVINISIFCFENLKIMNPAKPKIKIFLLLLFLSICLAKAQPQPYVLLISFDGFRWDYINRDITPNISELSENGVTASSLRPVFPTKTFPNHISTITGIYPENHGIIANEFIDIKNNDEYKMWDTSIVRNSKWYKGEAFWETARKHGVITASYFWPSSDVDDADKRPDYFLVYEHNKPYAERIAGVLNWLNLPYEKRPHFVTLYFDLADGVGHKFGPESEEINIAIAHLDTLVGLLTEGLKQINLIDSISIIISSDHGMTEVSEERLIVIDEKLSGYDYLSSNYGPFMLIYSKEHERENIYSILKEEENHYNVFKRKDFPEYFHFSQNDLIGNLVLIADVGWSLVNEENLEWMKNNTSRGNHGYDNFHIDMHGVFIAAGPLFKQDYKIGTINNIDIYPLLCKIFNCIPAENIDGDLRRIEYILK